MDIVVGMGETGKPWFNLISKVVRAIAVDIKPELSIGVWSGDEGCERLHICIPFSESFHQHVLDYVKTFGPKAVIIHSTVKPYTTKKLDEDPQLPRNVKLIYSPIRGIHQRMDYDLKRYDKFYASYEDDCSSFEELLESAGVIGYRVSNPLTLEFAKILTDTTYLAWLIVFSMKTEEIAMKYGLNYDELWMFALQIHEFLGNRPPCGAPGMNKIYPDPRGIGGHCVLPNLDLVKDDLGEVYDLIQLINSNCIRRHQNDRWRC